MLLFHKYTFPSIQFSSNAIIYKLQKILFLDGIGQFVVTLALPFFSIVLNFITFFKKTMSRFVSIGLIIINILYIVISSMIIILIATS